MAHCAPDLRFDAGKLDAACRALGLRLVVLFGSRASGSPIPSPESDLDLAILGGPAGWRECIRAFAEVFPDLEPDIVRIGEADPLFRQEIFGAGMLLWGDPDLFCEYKAFAYKDFVDSADLRELEAALFKKKMTHIRQTLDASR